MTCIVGVVKGGTVWMGGDRGSTDGSFIGVHSEPKVFASGQHIYGYSGSFGVGQAIQYRFTSPLITTPDEMHTLFIPALKAFFAGEGLGKDSPGCLLIGWSGHLYEYDIADHYLLECDEIAIGSGYQFALGSLHSTRGKSPGRRVEKALEAACDLSTSCSEPIDVVYLKSQ